MDYAPKNQRLEDMDFVISPNTGKKIDMNKLIEEQDRAKAALCTKYPFFNLLADKLKPIYTWEVETQATDGTRLFINPEFTDGLTLQQKIFVLAHEILHCALDHMGRAKLHGHDHKRSNIAGDYEINCTLALDGMISGAWLKNAGFLWDDKYDNKSYENIYNMNPPEGKEDNDYSAQEIEVNADADYIEGWKQAIEDYLSGKIKL